MTEMNDDSGLQLMIESTSSVLKSTTDSISKVVASGGDPAFIDRLVTIRNQLQEELDQLLGLAGSSQASSSSAAPSYPASSSSAAPSSSSSSSIMPAPTSPSKVPAPASAAASSSSSSAALPSPDLPLTQRASATAGMLYSMGCESLATGFQALLTALVIKVVATIQDLLQLYDEWQAERERTLKPSPEDWVKIMLLCWMIMKNKEEPKSSTEDMEEPKSSAEDMEEPKSSTEEPSGFKNSKYDDVD